MMMNLAFVAGKELAPPIKVLQVNEEVCLDCAFSIFQLTPDIQRVQLSICDGRHFLFWNWVPNVVMLDPLDPGFWQTGVDH